MKPIDRFSYLKNNRVSQDTSSLVQCYLPIIGQEALSLYLYTISFGIMVERIPLFKYSQSSQLWDGQTFKILENSICFQSLDTLSKGTLIS